MYTFGDLVVNLLPRCFRATMMVTAPPTPPDQFSSYVNANIHQFLTVFFIVTLEFFIQYFTNAVSKVLEDLCFFGVL